MDNYEKKNFVTDRQTKFNKAIEIIKKSESRNK